MKNNTYEKLLISFKENGGFFHKSLKINKDPNKGFCIIATEDININEILIDVPHNLLIPVDETKSLTKFKNKYSEYFFQTLLEHDQYLKTHPFNSNSFELEKINISIKKNTNLAKNFSIRLNNFNSLNSEQKKITLLASTRAIFIKKYKKKFFMPIMDFVNYHYDGLKYLIGNNGNIYIKSQEEIKKNQEILISYTLSDAISFFLKHGFIDESFRSFRIKKNELKLNLKSISTFNKNYFSKENEVYTFKESIYFYGSSFSKNIFKFLEIFPPNQKVEMFKKILNMYKNTIDIDKKGNIDDNSIILKNFYKSATLYKKIIDNCLNVFEKK